MFYNILCPFIFVIDRTVLNVLAADANLFIVLLTFLPALMVIYAVTTSSLNGLYVAAVCALLELDLDILSECWLKQPCEQLVVAVVKGLDADVDIIASWDTCKCLEVANK